jgi:quercetin dioxygenase-like cupin family protein
MKIIRLAGIPEENRNGYSIRRILTDPLKHNPENIGFYLTTIPALSKVKCHFHPLAVEIIIFLTNGTIRSGKQTYHLSTDDLIVISPREKHEIIADNEVRLLAVRIPNFPDDKVTCE